MDTSPDTTPGPSSGRTGTLIVLAVVTLVGAFAAYQLWPADERAPDDAAASVNSESESVPQQTTSPFLNTQPDVKYVGSSACTECHEDEHRTFTLTQHSRSLSLVKASEHPPDGFVDHALSHRSYEAQRSEGVDGDSIVQHREFILHDDGSRTELIAWPVRYQIGSGKVAESYFIEDGEFLVQSPITWYAEDQRWDMSPGYDAPDQMAFGRVIRSGCLYCHAGHLEDTDTNGFRHHITEHSIGCERCHGPGEKHVDLHQNGGNVAGEIDRTIVNPAHLSRELSESICAQCHLNGDVQSTVRGRNPHDYRPGLPLNEYRLEFRREQPDAEMRVAGHVEQLHQSLCYKTSDSLTCVTCHHPHEDLQPVERLARQRSICVSCHQQQPCEMPLAERESQNKDNCLECHMPQTATEVTHVALTHHRIGTHQPQEENSQPPARNSKRELVPLQPLNHLSKYDFYRAMGLAELKLVRMSGKSEEQMPELDHAASMLGQAYEHGLQDPEMLTALAGVARDLSLPEKGVEMAERALEAPDLKEEDRLVAMDVLAELRFRNGQLKESAEYLREITKKFRSPLHWYLLGEIARQQHNPKESLEAFREAVRLAPGVAAYHAALESALKLQGMNEEAKHHHELAELLFRAQAPPTEE